MLTKRCKWSQGAIVDLRMGLLAGEVSGSGALDAANLFRYIWSAWRRRPAKRLGSDVRSRS
jgi:hypothetical protein